MTITTGCGCCGCTKCQSPPKRLMISVEWPAGSGEVVAAGDDWSAVTTNCQPRLGLAQLLSVTVDAPGNGYTSAPRPTLSEGDGSLVAEIDSHLSSVEVTSGGSGYTSDLTGTIPFQPFEESRDATVIGIVRGGGVSTVVTAAGSNYTSPPVVSATGGTGLEATAVMSGYYASLELTNGGDGYTSAPTVVFGGSPTSSASAAASIRQFVESIAVTNGGSGYTSAPTVSVSGAGGGVVAVAQISGGVVTAIDVLNKGFGQIKFFLPFIPLVVTITGGGGSGATATATPYQPVTGVTLFSGGAGYVAGNSITFSGGGGSGATLTGTLRYRVASVTVQSGGSGYRPNAALTFSGGEGTGAAGRLNISGSVDEVVVVDGGRFFNRRRSDNHELTPWPTTVSWSGGGGGTGVAVALSFAPQGIRMIYVDGGGEYLTAPTISFSGGGGTGAAATAYLTWQQSHEVGIDFIDGACFADVGQFRLSGSVGFCNGTDSDLYPLEPISTAAICQRPPISRVNDEDGFAGVRHGESTSWLARARTDAVGTVPSARNIGGSSDVREYDRVFNGEGVWVYYYKSWGWLNRFGILNEFLWIKRLFSRVAPTNTWEIAQDAQTNAVLTPTLKQLEDLATQPLWWIASFAVTQPGSNLLTTPNQNQALLRPSSTGNAVDSLPVTADVTFSFSPPVPNSFSGPSFSVPPSFTATFAPDVIDGDYTLASIAINSAGSGGDNGTWTFTVFDLSVGHFPSGFGYGVPAFSGVVSGGAVQSVAITNAGRVRGGAAVASIALPADNDEYAYDGRVTVGSSTFQTVTTYSEPTVTATVSSGGATFSLTLAEEEDANGNPYWRVDSVSVVDGGSGYSVPVAIDFEASGPDGVESISAVAVASLPPREQPTLSVDGAGEFEIEYLESGEEWEISDISVVDGGSGYQYGQEAVFVLGDDDVQSSAASATIYTTLSEPAITAQVSSGSDAELEVTLQSTSGGWEIVSVAVTQAGTGYDDGEEVVFSGGDQGEPYAYATVSTDIDGAITGVVVYYGGLFYDDDGVAESVQINSGGLYYKQQSHLESVSLVSGGRYYNKTITETDQPLASPLLCNEEVSEENGWELLQYKPVGEEYAIDVGDTEVALAVQSLTEENSLGLSNDPSVFVDLTFTRRCGLPDLSFRLEQ